MNEWMNEQTSERANEWKNDSERMKWENEEEEDKEEEENHLWIKINWTKFLHGLLCMNFPFPVFLLVFFVILVVRMLS